MLSSRTIHIFARYLTKNICILRQLMQIVEMQCSFQFGPIGKVVHDDDCSDPLQRFHNVHHACNPLRVILKGCRYQGLVPRWSSGRTSQAENEVPGSIPGSDKKCYWAFSIKNIIVSSNHGVWICARLLKERAGFLVSRSLILFSVHIQHTVGGIRHSDGFTRWPEKIVYLQGTTLCYNLKSCRHKGTSHQN